MANDKDFVNLPITNWLPEDIVVRYEELSDELTNILNKWVAEYDTKNCQPQKSVPTPDEEKMVFKLYL